MGFSELFLGRKGVFSPDGRYILCIYDHTVDIRFYDSLLVVCSISCSDIVKAVKWSPDSVLVLCIIAESVIEVYSVRSGARIAVLRSPACSGLREALWTTDCRCFIALETQLCRVSLCTLDESTGRPGVEFIDGVQPWANPGITLSPDGKALAFARSPYSGTELKDQTQEFQWDSVCFYSTITWNMKECIQCVGIHRIGSMMWNHDSSTIVVWSLDPSDPVLILSALSGTIVTKWYQTDSPRWMGVAHLSFSPSSQFLAIGSQDGRVHILNYIGWHEEKELYHKSEVTSTTCNVYHQVRKEENFGDGSTYFKNILERPVSISLLSSPPKSHYTKVAWSSGGRFLASQSARAPAVVWIWDVGQLFSLYCVIVLEKPVQCMLWNPVGNTLAVCCGEDGVTLWHSNPEGAQLVSLHATISSMPFKIHHLGWCPNGKLLVVSSQRNSCILEIEDE